MQKNQKMGHLPLKTLRFIQGGGASICKTTGKYTNEVTIFGQNGPRIEGEGERESEQNEGSLLMMAFWLMLAGFIREALGGG